MFLCTPISFRRTPRASVVFEGLYSPFEWPSQSALTRGKCRTGGFLASSSLPQTDTALPPPSKPALSLLAILALPNCLSATAPFVLQHIKSLRIVDHCTFPPHDPSVGHYMCTMEHPSTNRLCYASTLIRWGWDTRRLGREQRVGMTLVADTG